MNIHFNEKDGWYSTDWPWSKRKLETPEQVSDKIISWMSLSKMTFNDVRFRYSSQQVPGFKEGYYNRLGSYLTKALGYRYRKDWRSLEAKVLKA